MRVLFLGPETSKVLTLLREREEVSNTSDKITSCDSDFIVSHGYRHIVPRDICEQFDGRAINLHISYLPWNRGADPNLWSHIDNTPKGVTIHYMAPGLDTGDIIFQREIEFSAEDTLASSYSKLQDAMFDLFAEKWHLIRRGDCPRALQSGRGSYHRSSDKEAVMHLLTDGWNTPISQIAASTNANSSS